MVVKDVTGGADLTAWGCLETNGEDVSAEKGQLIGELVRLEPHNALGIVLGVGLVVDTGVHGGKLNSVLDAGNEKMRVSQEV